MNHIVYITDENYILPTLVSLNSLVKNAAQKIAALYKFRLPEIFSDLDKILCIDGDIILKWKKVYSLSKKRRAEERRKRGNHAEFKAEVYGFLHDAFFL
ncbi:hypothetical protein [Treponema sp.]|uniref:hypothetical protein n=1 Tax=Treponema sp. TaxID=166 RepID=UPI0038902798